jgi:hypothetical protein
MTAFLNALRKLIEEFAPALAVFLWNYEQAKVGEATDKELQAQMELQIEKNHEAVDKKYIGRDDIDILNDAIANAGSGTGQLEGNTPTSGPAATRNTGGSSGNGTTH